MKCDLLRRDPVSNLDAATVSAFGHEWTSFDQSGTSPLELERLFEKYFDIFPWNTLNEAEATGADFGCGSGRWAKFVAGKVKNLHLIDASYDALQIAKKHLQETPNAIFHHGSVEELSVADQSLDFAYSLGVLHHVPDTQRAVRDIGQKLKPGAPFLIYLYYRFDNRPLWFRGMWKCSDWIRKGISRSPVWIRSPASFAIAAGLYWPLARLAKFLDRLDLLPPSFPLAFYRNLSFYIMRNDALDRFGTPIEKRFTKMEMETLLQQSGFEKVTFSEDTPFWRAVAFKK